MLRSLSIKKFRSIESDTIIFGTPVTILIGANGTGKTNLLLALRFICECVKHSPRRAVQMLDGLDGVFTIRENRSKDCSFLLGFEFDNVEVSKGQSFEKWEAEYGFDLCFDSSEGSLYVKKEVFRIFKSGQIKYEIYSRSGTPKSALTTQKDAILLDESIANKFFNNPEELLLPKIVRSGFAILRTSSSGVLAPIAMQIAQRCVDVMRGVTGYNFDPYALRKPSDILAGDSLSYDGKGFASFLNNTINVKKRMRSVDSRRLYGEDFLKKLSLIFSDALPFLSEFGVDEDMENTIVNLSFRESQQNASDRKFRSIHLSDGSLKFLAAVSMVIHGGYSILFIEELENYLNPRTITRLLELMKDLAETHRKTFIISTHSETILNYSIPEQLLISMRGGSGATTYRRLKSPNVVREALERGGFGLGYFWGMGGLDVYEE
ncbi:AAA family ATPase [Bdellovibrio sp. HCB209]|uniref:AAA family ATPase n=1 Tax=Bdellovibrio sp. HCB209 TaxID=3394354 RepID=UPI0039B42023